MSLNKGLITERINQCYSETYKTVKKEDDSETQVIILNSPTNLKDSNCAECTDPFYLLKGVKEK